MIEQRESYPLQWPEGVRRTEYPNASPFGDHSLERARDEVLRELNRFGATGVVITTNLETRNDGLPRARQRRLRDEGAAVYFVLDGKPHCFPCDRWDRLADNLWAIGKHIAAIRGMERWGVGETSQAFAGFALPAKGETGTGSTGRHWSDVLGLDPDPWHTEPNMVRERYRELAKTRHPDAGGTDEAFAELVRARDDALREIA